MRKIVQDGNRSGQKTRLRRVFLVGKEKMPKGIPKSRTKRSLSDIISTDLGTGLKLDELSTDSINLLNLMMLIVDIEYRHKYGGSIDWQVGTDNKQQSNQVLADQLPPIDDNSPARHTSMGDNC